MDTSLSDRLFSDPRLKLLSIEVGCPFKALGILGWLWHGSQNLGVSVSDECGILATFPLGVRGPRKTIAALERTGWLEKCEDGYRIVGNDDHLKRREIVSNKGKAGAAARWGKKDATGIDLALADGNADASIGQSPKMPSLPLPSSPLLSVKEEERGREEASKEFDDRSRIPIGHPDVAFFEADLNSRFQGPPLTPRERGDVAEIIRQCITAGITWQALLETYERKFESRKGSLSWLKFNAREVIRETPSGTKARSKSYAEKTAEEERARKERFAREEAEGKAQWEAEQRAKGEADGRVA